MFCSCLGKQGYSKVDRDPHSTAKWTYEQHFFSVSLFSVWT